MDSSRVNQTQSVPIPRSRIGTVVLWFLQVGIAAMLLFAGGSKLTGAPAMVSLFDTLGTGQWFRVVTGIIEVVSAVGLLIPALAGFAALLVVPTMIGAVATHLFIIGGGARSGRRHLGWSTGHSLGKTSPAACPRLEAKERASSSYERQAVLTFEEFEQLDIHEQPGKHELIHGELISIPPPELSHQEVARRVLFLLLRIAAVHDSRAHTVLRRGRSGSVGLDRKRRSMTVYAAQHDIVVRTAVRNEYRSELVGS